MTTYSDESNPPQIIPSLAESHTASEGGQPWGFKLRPGVRFHDAGDLTANDVTCGFHRVLPLHLAQPTAEPTSSSGPRGRGDK